MKKNKKNILSVIVLLIIIFLAFLYIKGHKQGLGQIQDISIMYIITLAALSSITILIAGLKIKVISSFFDIKLKLKEWFGLSAVTIMGNYLTPFKAGVSARAVYLKKKHLLPYTSFVSTISATYIINFFIYGLIGIVIGILVFKNNIILLSSLILFIIAFAFIFFSPKLSKTKYKKINYFIKVINDWALIRKDYKIVTMLGFLEIMNILVLSARFYVAFKALSSVISFNASVVYSLISVLSSVFTITPSGLGVREGLVAAFSKISGTGFGVGAYAASLDRAIAMIVIFGLGIVFSYILLRKQILKNGDK